MKPSEFMPVPYLNKDMEAVRQVALSHFGRFLNDLEKNNEQIFFEKNEK